MNPILRNIIAVVVALISGGVLNMALIMASGSIIPLPEGVDPSSSESLKQNMHLFEAKHFIMPFLAHALGTLLGALIVCFIAANHQMKFAILIGVIFLIGGIINVISLPAPAWFNAVDLIFAYIPMALLGWKLAGGKK